MSREYNSENAFAFETVTVPSGNVVATLSKIKYLPDSGGLPVRRAFVSVNPGAPISYTLNGLTASSATGHRVATFSSFSIDGYTNIKNFQTTSMASATTGEISVTYFR